MKPSQLLELTLRKLEQLNKSSLVDAYLAVNSINYQYITALLLFERGRVQYGLKYFGYSTSVKDREITSYQVDSNQYKWDLCNLIVDLENVGL